MKHCGRYGLGLALGMAGMAGALGGLEQGLINGAGFMLRMVCGLVLFSVTALALIRKGAEAGE